jgi:hypothetical protein
MTAGSLVNDAGWIAVAGGVPALLCTFSIEHVFLFYSGSVRFRLCFGILMMWTERATSGSTQTRILAADENLKGRTREGFDSYFNIRVNKYIYIYKD